MSIDELLSESIEDAQQRERRAFDEWAGDARDRIVLHGAGTLGRKIVRGLRAIGAAPLAFSDNNPALHGQRIEGVEVLSPTEAARRHGRDAVFVVTVFIPHGDQGMAARLDFLRGLGCARVTTFLPLAWKLAAWEEGEGSREQGDRGEDALASTVRSFDSSTQPSPLPHFGADLPSRLVARVDAWKTLAATWADAESRETFRRQLMWRLRGEFLPEPTAKEPQYFPCFLKPLSAEVFIDGGAFDGDTLRAIPWGFSRAVAFEPDPVNAAKLCLGKGSTEQEAGNLAAGANPASPPPSSFLPAPFSSGSVFVHQALLGDAPATVRFDARGDMGSARSESGMLSLPVVTLDDVLEHEQPTFLKLDVEGDEIAALRGARVMLQRAQPVVAVCVYHKSEDLWQIPLFLRETLPEHRLFLRLHENDGFELVAYAVPEARLARPGGGSKEQG